MPSSDVKYIGLDVHKEAISIAVLNGAGKLVLESIVETKASTLLDFLHGLRGELHVTLEEGTWAAWLYDVLKPHVQEILVCNPRRNALLKEGSKSDKVDARKLAELLRAGLLRAVYHGENGLRTLRELARSHAGSLRSRYSPSLSFFIRAAGICGAALKVELFKRLDRREVGLLDAPDHGSAIAFLDLGFEQRFQIAQVRLLLAHRFFGQAGELVGHGRQIELPRVLLNGGLLRSGWDVLTGPPPSPPASCIRGPQLFSRLPCWVAADHSGVNAPISTGRLR